MTLSKRAQYIKDHYKLIQKTENLWEAQNIWNDTHIEKIKGTTKESVCYEARCLWGHFNFEDEAREFSRIFS